MLSQWRISATNRRKGAWSRAFICGAQIKWYKRRIACVLRYAVTKVHRSKDEVCIGMTLCMCQHYVSRTLNHYEFIKNLSWEISNLIISEIISSKTRTKNGLFSFCWNPRVRFSWRLPRITAFMGQKWGRCEVEKPYTLRGNIPRIDRETTG
jgi:hypothetical protein